MTGKPETTFPSPAKTRYGSITRKTLKSMSVRIALVIVLTTMLSYFHMAETIKNRSLDQLEKYVVERGHRERMVFELAEDNHAILRQEVLAALDRLVGTDPVEEFESLFIEHADGVTRNRPELFDGTRQTGVYIDADVEIDADIRRRVLTYYDLCNRYGPAWHNRFQDTYITTPENIMAIYWPEVPEWCQNADVDLYMPDEEYVWVADLEHNPSRETAWTGLFYDHVAKVWMVSCETPVDWDQRHIATLGHDITLNELVERTLDDHLDGTFNIIYREDGRLIAHPDLMQEIQNQEGYFDIAESGDARLQSIVEAVQNRKPGVTVIDNPYNDSFLAVTTIDEPGWYFVTVLPKRILTAQAMKTAGFILILGIASLLVELIVLFFVLRRQVAERLKQFVEATTRIGEGRFDVRMDSGQDDELGQLAHSFNTMAHTIASRDKELERRRDQLENQVAQRTEALETTMRELEEAKLSSESANRSKSDFLANMSHEIRTPMTAILGFAELMTNPNQEPDERAQCVGTIMTNGEHLLSIINDVLDLSKIEAGSMTTERILCSPVHIVSEIAELLRPRALSRNLDLVTEFVGSIPSQITSDPTRIRQILVNLIGNAIKFTETGCVRIVVQMNTGSDQGSPQLRFDVIDTGIGLSQQQQTKLFRAFVQADTSTTRQFGGSGLGLVISKRFALLLGGEIMLTSKKGCGSTFSVVVDAGPLDGVKMLRHAVEVTPDASAVSEPTDVEQPLVCRILLAEDGPDNQRLISFILRKAGAEVEIADNGKIAYEKAMAAMNAGHPYDIVLMDMQMPEMDGYQATAQLRANKYPGAVIALTANAMSNDRGRCLEAGCDDYLAKPIKKPEFFRLIRRYALRESGRRRAS
jgi:signal transduction histidine kinase/CheY-like chemotaxis protein